MQKNKLMLLFLAIGVLAIGVYFLANRSSVFETRVERNSIESNAPLLSDTTATSIAYDPTVATTVTKTGWKTYNNPEYGFAFEYPSEYEVLIDDMGESDHLFSATLAHTKRPKEVELPGSDAVRIPFGGTSFYLRVSVMEGTISDIISKYSMETYEDVSFKNISLNSFLGTLVTSKDSLSGEFHNDVLFTMLGNKRVLGLGYMQNGGDDNMHIVPNSIFDTVLQSIRPYP